MMPVFEQRLGELVEILPEVVINETNFKVKYNWGTIEVLKEYLTKNPNCYPLVWLVPPKEEVNHNVEKCKSNCRIVIATVSDKQHDFNGFIYDTDYKIILNVIENNLIKALRQGGISTISDTYQRFKEPNYYVTLNKSQKPISVWNATFLDIEIEFNNHCLRPIIF